MVWHSVPPVCLGRHRELTPTLAGHPLLCSSPWVGRGAGGQPALCIVDLDGRGGAGGLEVAFVPLQGDATAGSPPGKEQPLAPCWAE